MSKQAKQNQNPLGLKEPLGQDHKGIVVEATHEMPSRGIVGVQTAVYIKDGVEEVRADAIRSKIQKSKQTRVSYSSLYPSGSQLHSMHQLEVVLI